MVMATDRLIDFEGNYGADYDHLIRLVIAAPWASCTDPRGPRHSPSRRARH